MDLLVRLFLRLGVLFEMPAPQQQPIPVPVRNGPPNAPGALR